MALLESNAVQLLLTATVGVGLYFFNVRRLILASGAIAAVGIYLSFVFMLGEVYNYSDHYRRAFFVFSDNVSSVFLFAFSCAFAMRRLAVATMCIAAMLMSGGKVSLILLLLVLTVFLLKRRHGFARTREARRIATSLCGGLAMYLAFLFCSNLLVDTPYFEPIRKTIAYAVAPFVSGSQAQLLGEDLPNNRGACPNLSLCFETQVQGAMQQRYYSSLGGLWMTMQGGFRGASYPNSPEQFASLMVEANPWGMNDMYQLDWAKWERIGAVQNPYLSFGSGYGPWLLLLLLSGVAMIALMAWQNLRHEVDDLSAMFTINYIAIAGFNQTQSWLMSGSLILVLVAFCACHVVLTWAIRKGMLQQNDLFKKNLLSSSGIGIG